MPLLPQSEIDKAVAELAASGEATYATESDLTTSQVEIEDPLADIKRTGKYNDDIAALRKMQEELFSYTTEDSESLPSLPINSLNVTEVKNAKSNFVYNFFTPNERSEKNVYTVNYRSDNTVIGSAVTDSDLIFLTNNELRKERLPMYNRITYSFNANENLISLRGLVDGSNAPLSGFQLYFDDLLKYAISEDNLSNRYYSGVEFIDTLADVKIYRILSSSIVFQNQDNARYSLSQRTENFLEEIGTDENFSIENKLTLAKILNNYQAEGLVRASSDTNQAALDDSMDPITQQAFSTKFNNLFFHDIVNFNLQTRNTVYSDEFMSLAVPSAHAQQSLHNTARGMSGLSSSDYEIQVNPASLEEITLDLENIDENGTDIQDFKNQVKDFPKVEIIGILIQKYEITNSGVIKKKNFFIDDPQNLETEIIDSEVKYGAAYIYRIRTLCVVTTIYEIDNDEDEIKLFVGKYIVASNGKIIVSDCTENIPPPPPQTIKAKVNYNEQKPEISWEFPFNSQRDIKRFQIFKRRSLNDGFTLVKEYNFDNSEIKSSVNEVALAKNIETINFPKIKYVDLDFDLKKDVAIYAIASVDAHGLSSGFSPQLLVQYDRFNNRLKNDIISRLGAPKPYPNLYIEQDFFEDAIKTSGYTRCNIFFDPEYYKAYKTDVNPTTSEEINSSVKLIKFSDANETNEENFPYLFHFLNVDNQKEEFLKFKIIDKSGIPAEIDPANISIDNLHFELGVTPNENS